MSMRKLAIATGLLLTLGTAALAEGPQLGKPINPKDFAAWDLNVLPDGSNLPPGSGRAPDGGKIFADQCALCHGDDGAGTELGKRFKVKDLRSKEVQDKSSADLALIVHDGKNNMPPFGKRLDDKQIESLIGYIRHLATPSH